MSFAIPGFDLAAFVSATLAEDLGQGWPGGGHDVTSESVIPAGARFGGVMDSRDAIVVCGLPLAEAFSARLIRPSRSKSHRPSARQGSRSPDAGNRPGIWGDRQRL